MHYSTHRYVASTLPQYRLSKNVVKPMEYCTFRSRGLQMASHEVMALARILITNEQRVIPKNHFPENEAQSE